jgi:hypothetical protein
MKRLRGSFSEKNQPIITLTEVVDDSLGGTIKTHQPELSKVDPIPTTWLMLKGGDVLVSQSGSIRALLRKDWQSGQAESLRFKCENKDNKLNALLDIEKTLIDSSNFHNLAFVLRDAYRNSVPEFSAQLFSKIVRFNILSLLGFGVVGSKLHHLLSFYNDPNKPSSSASFGFQCESRNGLFENVIDIQDSRKAQETLSKSTKIPIVIHWTREADRGLFRIAEFDYPQGVEAVIIETITLSCEMANVLSYSSDIFSDRR